MTILPLPFLPFPPTAPPLGSTTAAREADGADPVAPTPSPPSRGLLPNDLVTVDGRAGEFMVRKVVGDACEVVAGGSFWSVPLGAVRRV